MRGAAYVVLAQNLRLGIRHGHKFGQEKGKMRFMFRMSKPSSRMQGAYPELVPRVPAFRPL